MQFISSGNLRALFLLCVCIPLFLAISSIISTIVDSQLQSQAVLGIPLFLWFWVGVSLIICTIILLVGSKLTFKTTDDNLTHLDANSKEQGERHE